MFDPSKLNLDLENTEKNKNQKKDTNNSDTTKKINLEKNSNNDILNDINLVQKSNSQTNPTNKILEKQDKDNKNLHNSVLKEEEKDEKIINTDTVIKEKNNTEKKSEKILIKNNPILEKEKIIYDINLNSIDILLTILIDNNYDFAIFEPDELAVKVIFKKDKSVKDVKYIKFPIYSNILLKAKALTHLKIEEIDDEQEGSGEKVIKNNTYKIISKVVPSELGSKLFIKSTPIEKKVVKKNTKKKTINQFLTFIGAISFITLIIGTAFIGFIALNAKTIEDVKFFYSLGINLNDINNFIGQALSVVFSMIIFIETIFLVTFLFKFSLTKKEYKQKKIRYGILSTIILIVTFSTVSAWMIIDQKIKSLPNWQEVAYGEIQVYDNVKLLSDFFNKQGSLIQDTTDLIGPIQIKFDLSFFEKKEKQKGIITKKYIWDFGNGEIKETSIPTIIYNFNEKGNYNVTLKVEQEDLQGKSIEKIVENIPIINVSYVVNINEKILSNGGKTVDFDASSLKELGKIEWYFTEDLNKPIWSDYIFRMSKPIFKETLVGMYIKRNDKEDETLDKVFVITGAEESKLNGKISYKRSLIDDLEFDLQVDNLVNDFGNGFIEEFKWVILDKEISKVGDILEPTKSSKINFKFPSYGDYEVLVILKNSAGEEKRIKTNINIPKKLKLSQKLKLYNNDVLIDNVNYEEELNEYYINEIGIPTSLKLDARLIRSDNLLYTLKKVSWDYNSDGDIDKISKIGNYNINVEGNHTITVFYEFVHRKISTDIIKIKEQIFIEGLKKEAIITFDITKNSSYVPVTVSFDASKSKVKNNNIVKFIWDYGDGIIEERDSIVPGHKYSTPGNYDIKLTVVTTNGKEYSFSKKLILKPKPQSIKITTSLKKAKILQGIDFSSEKSVGQITSYFWDFGDGNISTDSNPTHQYKKAGIYDVKLRLDFSNKNVLEKSIKIEIFE